MSWPAALLALLVSHLVGDFLLQTEWQALNKMRGLTDSASRRALGRHLFNYSIAFIPALVWIGLETSTARAVAVGALVAIPHLLIDDGRLVRIWLREVKHAPETAPMVWLMVDQTFHVLCLLGAALLAAA